MLKKDRKVIIIGAGPAGISAGYMLSKHTHVEIFEASPYIGGMSRSLDLWEQRVDLGPHRFFSKDQDINHFFHEVLGNEYTQVSRLTRIYYKNRFFDYPLKIFNVLSNLRITTVATILIDYVKQRLSPIKNPDTFEKWVTNRFGKKLYTIFFKHYSEKLWGISCDRIDAEWAAQRIKNLSLFEAVWSALKGNAGNKHKTLVDEFSYPKNGTGSLYEKAANCIEENGGKIYKNYPITKVLIEDNNCKGVMTGDGKVHYADTIISSMPITLLLKGIEGVPDYVIQASNQLYFRNTILVYLEVDDDQLFKDNWIYVHSPDVTHGRITNFRNWCPSLTKGKNTSILCMEFWAFDKETIWTASDKELSELASKELRILKLVPEDKKILNSKIIRVPKCYPVYEIGYKQYLQPITDYLKKMENLIPIGRYGTFKYNNQDHSILMGIIAARKILGTSDADLWEINTDTEYQEDGKVKDVLRG